MQPCAALGLMMELVLRLRMFFGGRANVRCGIDQWPRNGVLELPAEVRNTGAAQDETDKVGRAVRHRYRIR